MTDVFMERHWAQPTTQAYIEARLIASDGCMGIHHVAWQGSLLSDDGHDLFCHFRSRDAESVRIAIQQSGGTAGALWPCRIQDAPGLEEADLRRANVVVRHRFAASADFGARQMLEDVGVGGVESEAVCFARSYLSYDGLRMFCLYRAPDAEALRLRQRGAGLQPDRVWAVRHFAP